MVSRSRCDVLRWALALGTFTWGDVQGAVLLLLLHLEIQTPRCYQHRQGEEHYLARFFGPEWAAYRAATCSGIPGIP